MPKEIYCILDMFFFCLLLKYDILSDMAIISIVFLQTGELLGILSRSGFLKKGLPASGEQASIVVVGVGRFELPTS